MLDENPESLLRSWLTDYGAAVMRVARAYTNSVEDQQDLAQEILLQIWRSLPKFQGQASAFTWLYRVALNTALDWRRKKRRRPADALSVFEIEDPIAIGLDSSQQVVEQENVERLYGAIRLLPKADAALILLYLDDLSYREISEVLGISENNVGVKLNRAKKALCELMKDQSHES